MKMDRSLWYTNHVQWHTNHVKEEVKSTILADSYSQHKPIDKVHVDIQREIQIALTKKKTTT